jgi:hypothetical protein
MAEVSKKRLYWELAVGRVLVPLLCFLGYRC